MDVAGWQAQGRHHFQEKQYKEASRCYDQGLRLLDCANICKASSEGPSQKSSQKGSEPSGAAGALSSILLNLSTTHLKLGNKNCALTAAVAAASISPDNGKAHYRRAPRSPFKSFT